MGKSLGRERNFEEVYFEPGTEYGILVERTSFGYQEGVNSRVVYLVCVQSLQPYIT